MQEELESEILTREIFYRAKGKAGNVKELKDLLNELMVLDTLKIKKISISKIS